MRQGSKGLARGRAATRGSGGTHRGVLSAVEVAGLGLLLVGVPIVFDPFGRSGYLAVKVLVASAGVALLGYGLQQQVSFPHPATDAVFWLLAGVLVTASSVRARPMRSWLINDG